MYKLIDTHCHLDLSVFNPDRLEILRRCQQKNIHQIVVPAIKRSNWDTMLEVCHKHNQLVPALGLHPYFIEDHSLSDLDDLRQYIQTSNAIAIGEIGLDYYRKDLDLEKQLTFFEAQLAIAEQFKLPVIMHIRKAHDLAILTLKKYKLNGGIVHAYSGNFEQAKYYIAMDFKLGFGGMLTFERSRKLHQLAEKLPLESIVLETDAPDMTVASHQGERNSPEYLDECLQALARIKNLPLETIAQHTTDNAYMALPKLAEHTRRNSNNPV